VLLSTSPGTTSRLDVQGYVMMVLRHFLVCLPDI
jgi:hypothetical protein